MDGEIEQEAPAVAVVVEAVPAAMTAADIDRIFNDHYAGNAMVLTPEFNRVHIFREALKKHLQGGN